MSEIFSQNDIGYIILYNKRIVEKRGELFEVDKVSLYIIFNKMNSYNDIQNKRERIIKKTSRILAGISFYQPFYEGNKRTALSATRLFLRRNGFNLPLHTTIEKNDIYTLLNKTISKFTNDPTIYREVEEYLSKRVVSYFIKDGSSLASAS